jgi:hypothetical protein
MILRKECRFHPEELLEFVKMWIMFEAGSFEAVTEATISVAAGHHPLIIRDPCDPLCVPINMMFCPITLVVLCSFT